MKRLFPIISIPALIFFLLSFFPISLSAAPSLAFSVGAGRLMVRKPFSIELTISWEGDAEQYLVETPRLKLPQEITLSGSSFSTGAQENSCFLRYRYTLSAAKTGSYVLDPVEISYWEKDAGDARTTRTEELHFKVSSWSEIALKSYWMPGVVLLFFISLFMMLFVLSTKKKRAGNTAPADGITMEEIIVREMTRCRTYKISGDWDAYIRQVIAIHRTLPPAQKDETLLTGLYRIAERVQYGGYRPSEDEIDLIERQLEKAYAGAFPNKENKIIR